MGFQFFSTPWALRTLDFLPRLPQPGGFPDLFSIPSFDFSGLIQKETDEALRLVDYLSRVGKGLFDVVNEEHKPLRPRLRRRRRGWEQLIFDELSERHGPFAAKVIMAVGRAYLEYYTEYFNPANYIFPGRFFTYGNEKFIPWLGAINAIGASGLAGYAIYKSVTSGAVFSPKPLSITNARPLVTGTPLASPSGLRPLKARFTPPSSLATNPAIAQAVAQDILAWRLATNPADADLIGVLRQILRRANSGIGISQVEFDILRLSERYFGIASDHLRQAALTSQAFMQPASSPSRALVALRDRLQAESSARAIAQIRAAVASTGQTVSTTENVLNTVGRGRSIVNLTKSAVGGVLNAVDNIALNAVKRLNPLLYGLQVATVLSDSAKSLTERRAITLDLENVVFPVGDFSQWLTYGYLQAPQRVPIIIPLPRSPYPASGVRRRGQEYAAARNLADHIASERARLQAEASEIEIAGQQHQQNVIRHFIRLQQQERARKRAEYIAQFGGKAFQTNPVANSSGDFFGDSLPKWLFAPRVSTAWRLGPLGQFFDPVNYDLVERGMNGRYVPRWTPKRRFGAQGSMTWEEFVENTLNLASSFRGGPPLSERGPHGPSWDDSSRRIMGQQRQRVISVLAIQAQQNSAGVPPAPSVAGSLPSGKYRYNWYYKGRDRDLITQTLRDMQAIVARDELAASSKPTTTISTRALIFPLEAEYFPWPVQTVIYQLEYALSLVRDSNVTGGYYSLWEL